MRAATTLRAGFTLVEVLTVVVVLSILAAAVAPGIGSMRSRSADAAAEVVRGSLRSARAMAGASGVPTGVEIDVVLDRSQIVVVDGGDVVPAPGVLGTAQPPVWVSADFVGASILSVTPSDGSSPTAGVIWFGFDGAPQARDAEGVLLGGDPVESLIELTGGREIRVDPVTGRIR
ncbi:MAG: prepilin-type N-terminal cleavage/methylation domain-containing protein [Planctomycetota bacterium]